jgi:hypothetical protein
MISYMQIITSKSDLFPDYILYVGENYFTDAGNPGVLISGR